MRGDGRRGDRPFTLKATARDALCITKLVRPRLVGKSPAVVDMERISLLSVSKVEPAVSIGPHSTVVRRLSPSLILATRWQRFVATTSSSVLLHAYLAASATLVH